MFAVISAFLDQHDLTTNLVRHADLGSTLRRSPYMFREARGSFEGSFELSYQIEKPEAVPFSEWLSEINSLAFDEFGQAATLIVDDAINGRPGFLAQDAALYYADGSVESGLHWQITTCEGAAASRGFTEIGGLFWILVPSSTWRIDDQ